MDRTVVYLGNIPFEYTEERVLEIAKSVGPVENLNLVFDPISGKSKGHAFVKYSDAETAESAVRNLNNSNLGNRTLKCSISSEKNQMEMNSESEKLPALPLGVQLFQNQTTSQVISGILSQLDENTATQLLKEAKDMSSTNPILMEKLLDKCPQLAQALVEASLLLNVTTPETIDICVNKRKQPIERLMPDHLSLLQSVKDMTDEDIQNLDSDKQKILNKLKKEIESGSFGTI